MCEPGAVTPAQLGWTPRWQAFVTLAEGDVGQPLTPARVSAVHRGHVDVLELFAAPDSSEDERVAGISVAGEPRTIALDLPGHCEDDEQWPPLVGDWVGIDDEDRIRVVVNRQNYLERRSADERRAQPIAANVDYLMIVEPLRPAPSLGRIERFVTMASQSGITPVVILTKRDLVDDEEVEGFRAELSALGVDVLAVNLLQPDALEGLSRILQTGQTYILVGRSGAGKTTLTNLITGGQRATAQVRGGDYKGRHTTTSRELLAGSRGTVIDTPGIRALAVTAGKEAIDATFADIAELATQCRYNDCAHASELDCRVQEALADGELDRTRFERYRRMVADSLRQESQGDQRLKRASERRASKENQRGRRGVMRLKGRDR